MSFNVYIQRRVGGMEGYNHWIVTSHFTRCSLCIRPTDERFSVKKPRRGKDRLRVTGLTVFQSLPRWLLVKGRLQKLQ